MADQPVKRGPGRPRKDASASGPMSLPPAKPVEAQPCEECFPDGWAGLGKDAYSAGCAHGAATRDIPA